MEQVEYHDVNIQRNCDVIYSSSRAIINGAIEGLSLEIIATDAVH